MKNVPVRAVTFLGIDIGTSSVKAQTIDDKGKLLEFASNEASNLIRRLEPTWAERDPEAMWKVVCKTLKSMEHLQEVEAISLAATSGSVLAVNTELKALSPILLHSDKRAEAEVNHIRETSAEARAYEPYLPLDASLATPKILWLMHHIPNFSGVKAILNETDYFQAKLTGEIFTSASIAGKAHTDVRSGKYIERIFDDVGIDPALLPQIRPIGSTIGAVTKRASSGTGIASGALVVNGVTDATAADISTGILVEGQANISIGTSLVAHVVVGKALPDFRKRIYYKPYVDGKIIAGGATDAGTLPLASLARLVGKSVQELDSLAEMVPPSCDGLLAQPQWVGSRIPYNNPTIRGFFVGITEHNLSPGHLHRSLLEGNAFVTEQVLDVVKNVTGFEPRELKTSGGGSRSDVQNQILADVTGVPVTAVETPGASLGSAMLALSSLKRGLSLQKIAELTVRIRKKFVPNQNSHLLYKQGLSKFVSVTDALYSKN
jgi:sugar (pentulose or hexulose) kinase